MLTVDSAFLAELQKMNAADIAAFARKQAEKETPARPWMEQKIVTFLTKLQAQQPKAA